MFDRMLSRDTSRFVRTRVSTPAYIPACAADSNAVATERASGNNRPDGTVLRIEPAY